MDHLPTPFSSVPPIEIPFVADYPWDFLDFETFHKRQGFAVDGDNRLLLDAVNSERLASLLQSWLYFGLLSDVLGPKVCTDDFRRKRPAYSNIPPAIIVDSTVLASLIEAILKDLYKHKGFFESCRWNLLFKRSGLTTKIGSRVRYTLETCARVSLHPIAEFHPLTEIIYSIEVLCKTLERFFDSREPREVTTAENGYITPTSLALVYRQMTRVGWCRSVAKTLSKEQDILTLHYISRMKPLIVPWITHRHCSDFVCSANHVNTDTYNNRHVIEGCVCAPVSLDGNSRSELNEIIKKGGVPLIGIQDSATAGMSLIVKEYTPGTSYVAISHVWSDGLGNPFANALPRCQLQKLAKYLKIQPRDKIMSNNSINLGVNPRYTLWFWMDTLCIPPAKPTDLEYPLRLDCIDRMALIYASARRVMILDHSLQQVRLSSFSYTEILVHINCCAWNQRSWTLQEGALANKNLFQLADCSFDPFLGFRFMESRPLSLSSFRKQTWIEQVADAMNRWHIRRDFKSRFNVDGNQYGMHCERALSRVIRGRMIVSLKETLQGISRDAFQGKHSRATYNFAKAWNNLRKRSTTKPEDMYIVLANLLGFFPNQLQRIQRNERLRAIIFNMEYVPQSLLYNTGKKFCSRDGGENWVPTELSQEELSDLPAMKRIPRGFCISSDGEMNAGFIQITPSICRDGGPIWLCCGYVHRSSGLQILNLWIKIDVFRPLSLREYDPAEFDSSCILIEQNEILNPTPRVSWRASLLHVSPADRSSPNTSAQQSNSGHRLPSPETFRATYDCPARVSISLEPEPQGEWDYNLNQPKEDNRKKDLRFLLLKVPPWRVDDETYQAKKLKIASPNFVQDDMLGDPARLINSPCSPHAGVFGKKHGQIPELVFESTCSVRFPRSWKLVLPVGKDKAVPPLSVRPFPVYNFLYSRANVFLYAVRLIVIAAPLACVILIALHAKELAPLSRKNWSWKIALTSHVVYIVGNLGTITLSTATTFVCLGLYYVAIGGLIVPLVFLVSSFKVLVISKVELYYVIAPLAGCGSLTIFLVFYFFSKLKAIGHRHWLSTFDRNWQDESTPWYWRPTTFWGFLKLVFGVKFLRLLRRRQDTTIE